MKNMLRSLALLCVLAFTAAHAQQPAASPPAPDAAFIKGDLSIQFNTRTQLDGGKPREGVADKYKLKLNVSNSVVFDGTIESLPNIKGMVSLNQPGRLTHSIECLVVNPRNPSQTRNIGRLFGTVPVDTENVYRFEDGNLKIGVFGVGNAQPFESRVRGLALGKPTSSGEGFFAKMKKEAMQITKSVGGKNVAIAVTKYDRMEFVNHVLSAGPVMVYPEVTVSGTTIYDYDRTAWYLNGVTVSYSMEDARGLRVAVQDRLSGNIRWVEAADRGRSGLGEYQFDVRVNEPAASEASIFAGAATEADFFATDALNPSLTGTMKYKDSIQNDVVSSSQVSVDLTGNKLTKQQVMYLAKLLLMSSIVPLNAE